MLLDGVCTALQVDCCHALYVSWVAGGAKKVLSAGIGILFLCVSSVCWVLDFWAAGCVFPCFSRMRSKGSRFHSGGLEAEGVFARRCLTVRNRPQPFATVRNRRGHLRFHMWHCFVSHGRWHFVTFRRVWQRVLCDVFRRCVAVFMAGAALQTCRVACFLRIVLSGLRQVATRCKFHGRRGIL